MSRCSKPLDDLLCPAIGCPNWLLVCKSLKIVKVGIFSREVK